MSKSVEELVEDWAKKSFDGCDAKHFAKNAAINSEIGAALRSVPTLSGGGTA